MNFTIQKSLLQIGSNFLRLNKNFLVNNKINIRPKKTSVCSNFIYIRSSRAFSNMTAYSENYIKERLKEELNPEHLEVVDYSDGCGAKFNVVIVSDKFEGKSLLERHRMVNNIFSEELKTIHAFTQKTMTPEQWKKLNDAQ